MLEALPHYAMNNLVRILMFVCDGLTREKALIV